MAGIDKEVSAMPLKHSTEEKKKSKRADCWVRPKNLKRKHLGEFYCKFGELLDDSEKFFHYFRMTYDKFNELLEILTPSIVRQHTNFREPIEPRERLAVCLRFLASGDSFRSISESYLMGTATVSLIVYTTCEAIWETLSPIVIPKPGKAVWSSNEEEFTRKFNLPNCVGSLHGRHIVRRKGLIGLKPHLTKNAYLDYVLLALVDAANRFVCVDVGQYVNDSDKSIFSSSNLGKQFSSNTLDFPEDKPLPGTNVPLPHYVIADETFPPRSNIIRPYPVLRTKENEKNKIFNETIKMARNSSENAFTMLTKKFGIFEKGLVITEDKLQRVVFAVCCLHNFLLEDKCYWTSEHELKSVVGLTNLNGIGGQSTIEAAKVRDSLRDYFYTLQQTVSLETDVAKGEPSGIQRFPPSLETEDITEEEFKYEIQQEVPPLEDDPLKMEESNLFELMQNI